MANLGMRIFTGLHGQLVKFTGKFGGGTKDGSILVLRHYGAKSGTERETPLVFINTEERYAVAASMAGAPNNPGWYHNLLANPDTEVIINKRTIPVRARETSREERAPLWSRFKGLEDRWEKYEARTDRTIPVIALDKR